MRNEPSAGKREVNGDRVGSCIPQCAIVRPELTQPGHVLDVEPLVGRRYLSTRHFRFPKAAARISASRTGVGFHRPPLTTNRL